MYLLFLWFFAIALVSQSGRMGVICFHESVQVAIHASAADCSTSREEAGCGWKHWCAWSGSSFSFAHFICIVYDTIGLLTDNSSSIFLVLYGSSALKVFNSGSLTRTSSNALFEGNASVRVWKVFMQAGDITVREAALKLLRNCHVWHKPFLPHPSTIGEEVVERRCYRVHRCGVKCFAVIVSKQLLLFLFSADMKFKHGCIDVWARRKAMSDGDRWIAQKHCRNAVQHEVNRNHFDSGKLSRKQGNLQSRVRAMELPPAKRAKPGPTEDGSLEAFIP